MDTVLIPLSREGSWPDCLLVLTASSSNLSNTRFVKTEFADLGMAKVE